MGNTKEAVIFLLPNGAEVSNDPRYHEEKMRQQIMKSLGENTGKATLSTQAMNDQLGTGGQRTVFTGQDVSVPSQPVHITGISGEAANAEPQEPGDPADEDDEDYSTWKAQKLKDEVKRRKAEGRDLDISNVTKKSQLVRILEADDEAQAQE